jgi:hypothetical protein
MLQTILKYLEEERACPHCKTKLELCHAPPVHVGDGLGWGSEYLFICLNDECSLFAGGWEHIENQYGHVGSYRYMEIPGGKESYNMMVAGAGAFTGSIVDVELIKKENKRYQRSRKALAALDTCLEDKNIEPVIVLITDEGTGVKNRKKAIALLVPFNDLSCIEAVRNHTFKDSSLQMEVDKAIATLLANNFQKECPFCKELIKARATVCKHCQKELS